MMEEGSRYFQDLQKEAIILPLSLAMDPIFESIYDLQITQTISLTPPSLPVSPGETNNPYYERVIG